MVYANGIGPINKKLNRTLTKHILNKAELITLRDENSKETLVEIGVHKTRQEFLRYLKRRIYQQIKNSLV